jgi:hypothetical protein
MEKLQDALIQKVMVDLGQFLEVDNLDELPAPEAVSQFAARHLLKSLFKKWREPSEKADTRALLTFLEANHLSERWAPPVLDWDSPDRVILEEVRLSLMASST